MSVRFFSDEEYFSTVGEMTLLRSRRNSLLVQLS